MSESGEVLRTALEVTCVALRLEDEPNSSSGLHVLLVRGRPMFSSEAWSLATGCVRADESFEDAVRRVLGETGAVVRHLGQLRTDCATSPSGERMVSVAYVALVAGQERSASDVVGWFPLAALPELTAAHGDLIDSAIDRVRENIRQTPVGSGFPSHVRQSAGYGSGAGVLELLPPRFSLTQLQRLCEAIEGTEFDKRNFRKKVLATGLFVETDEVEQGVAHRAAKLYRFDRRKYDRSAKGSSASG